ncbi:MAG: hypothetical protein ACXVH3_27900 [Solirubrobacteraceae bacterium]
MRRSALWKPATKRGKTATKWQPCRHVAICMWASSARHVSGQEDERVGELIEAKDPRTIRRAVGIGDRSWASLGAWPWATREDGALPIDWWQLNDIWEALADQIALRMRRGERLVATLRQ